MPTFTIHAPPPKGEAASDPERFVFVRDGFHFWAFVLAPLWLLRYRLWFALVLYVVLYGALVAAMAVLRFPSSAQVVVGLLVALLIGIEASSIRRWTLTRRGFRPLGFVVGEDREMAERRFYAAWAERTETVMPAPPPPQYSTPVRRGPPTGSDVIGLFPEPGGSR